MRSSRMLLLCLAGLLWLATTACDCGDTGFEETNPVLELYAVAELPGAPALDAMNPIPDDDRIGVAFGLVDVGLVAHRYLFLRNTGKGDLLLLGAEIDPASSADFVIGCLDGGQFVTDCAYNPQQPLRITPGRDLVVEIRYAPAAAGADSGSFELLFNVATPQRVSVELTAEAVTPEVQVCFADCVGDRADPACAGAAPICNDEVERDQFVLRFGEVEMEGAAERRVTVRNLGQQPLDVTAVDLASVSHQQYTLDLTASGLPGELAAGAETELTVRFGPQWGGPHNDNLVVQSSDVNEPEVVVQLAGQGVAPRVCPEPLLLDFGNVQVGEPAVERFRLESCGLEQLHLIDLALNAGSSPDFSLPDPPNLPQNLAPGAAVEVEVQYLPESAGSDSGGVDIFSDDQSADPDSGLTGTVVLQGNGVDRACDIQATPFAINFGVVVVDTATPMDVVIANVGTDPCTISDIALTTNSADGEFSLTQNPGAQTLAAGDMVTATVEYHPVGPDLGQDTGVLSVFANDKDTDEVRIDLNGFSVPPEGDGPVAVCSVNPTQAAPFETVTWDGSQSYDSNNRPLVEYRWEIFAFPPGSGSTLRGSGASRTTEVDFAGDYIASLVVVNDLGQTSSRCYATTTVTPTQELWIEMFWQHSGDDMDLHLLSPTGTPRTAGDCYYANCVPVMGITLEWGVAGYAGDNPRLDRDDISGDGPENINIANPIDGSYTVFVHDFPGSSYQAGNEVTVKVYVDGVFQQEFNHTMVGEDDDWYVCTVDWPSGTVTPY